MAFLSTFCGCGQGNVKNTQKVLLTCENDTSDKKNIDQNEVIITLKDEVLNGRIKTINEKRIYNNKIDSFAYFFIELGLLVAEESSLFAGLNKKAIYTYNSDNQRIMTKMYDRDENQTDYIEFTYDNGNLIKRFYKHAASTPKITRYVDYDIDTYKHDENGNIIEKKRITKRKNSRDEILQEYIKYQYDSIGSCIIEEELGLSGKVVERKNNKYINRKLVETFTWQLFEGEDLYLKDTYEYNEDGTMKSHTHIIYMYSSTDEEVDKWTENYSYSYEYDNEGRLIGETKTTETTSRISEMPIKTATWKHIDFDDYGNWIQKTMGNSVIKREIEYYER
jgi:hypothetical protein